MFVKQAFNPQNRLKIGRSSNHSDSSYFTEVLFFVKKIRPLALFCAFNYNNSP